MIELRIDRVILEGIDPRHAQVVREALEAELTRLVASAHWPKSRQDRQASAPAIPATPNPTTLGENLARSVYQSIRREEQDEYRV
jgi:hypothetical protein